MVRVSLEDIIKLRNFSPFNSETEMIRYLRTTHRQSFNKLDIIRQISFHITDIFEDPIYVKNVDRALKLSQK